MVAGLTSGDGYTGMNPLSVFSAPFCFSTFKEKKLMILHVPKKMTS